MAATGLPLTRPLLLHYAADPVACRVATQFLIGRDILAAGQPLLLLSPQFQHPLGTFQKDTIPKDLEGPEG